ncbi:MAG: farnesyl-diphosphate synthase [Deltaproteobacteria bacterium CG_4_10_14_3_um_filter_60_8]|nr:MAG: farnesyl-diphosphate synthase [Desulfobacterales bacterium CG2_30_60_27]PIP43494.1 MAG: farnesyl-diphosphate synthase [Deltaproteobacteria bacterium CG23_combo_of_CG06-09_8_20_14_all_60_8]PIY20771.1 MAG: farnesyl-diphosphate synthase [Deltaproteobacteria bacterium CG_4_10_14_3_um_filter_60_8]
MDIKQHLNDQRLLVETALNTFLPKEEGLLADHFAALRYSLVAGGKRIRPVLCMMTAEALGARMEACMAIPCALECIHTYSLIHDDLPAMDNDDLRRGKPTNHKVFGEAQAILAGDGLLTMAFALLSDDALPDRLSSADRLRIIHLIARAAGSHGMVGGQALDVASEGKTVPFETLAAIHASKTGALITASVQAGAILGGATTAQYEDLTAYGQHLGLAFQITDDLLNVEGSPAELGKAAGSDAARRKATYPGFFGVETTRRKAGEAIKAAVDRLAPFGTTATPLRELARYLLKRSK